MIQSFDSGDVQREIWPWTVIAINQDGRIVGRFQTRETAIERARKLNEQTPNVIYIAHRPRAAKERA